MVEDEEEVRTFLAQVLKEHNYKVFAAQNAQEALDVFNGERGNFHLIFCDVMLPNGDGLSLIEEVKRGNPDIPAIMTSGYASDKAKRAAVLERGLPFLQKPYSVITLLKTIRNVLGKG